MNKIKKIGALSLGLIMTVSLFTGCSTDGLALINAFAKSQTINSVQTETEMSIRVSGSNMSVQEEQMMNGILPIINGAKMYVLTKSNQNQEKTIAKVQSDINLQLGEMHVGMTSWVNVDTTGDKPVVNEMFKIPQLLSSQLPKELQGKDYMVMDLTDMTSTSGMSETNYKKLMSFSKEFQPKLLDFIVKYAKQFNPNTEYIKFMGSQRFLQDNKMQSTTEYEVKLTDKSFKELMRYTLNNLAGNADAMNFVKEYMISMMSVYDLTDVEAESSKDEINKAFDNFTIQLPQQLVGLNKALDSIDNLKILGNNGITIRYTINDDGYIVKEKGNAEFVVDLPSIMKLAGNSQEDSNPNDPTGIYTINVAFNTENTNINGDVKISFPKVDSTNSFNYMDIMNISSVK